MLGLRHSDLGISPQVQYHVTDSALQNEFCDLQDREVNSQVPVKGTILSRKGIVTWF